MPAGGRKTREPQRRENAALQTGLAPRLAAAAIVGEVLVKRQALDERFRDASAHPALVHLDPRDRALARSIATVALRRLGTIRKALAVFLKRGMPRRAGELEWHLVIAAAQVLFLEVPDHAAVDLGVRAVRSAPLSAPFAPLANAVLRNVARQREEILASSDPLDDDTPHWLAERWRNAYGVAVARAIAAAHRLEPTLDLTVPRDPTAWAQRLGGIVLPTGSVRLVAHTPVPQIEGYAEGAWWVQDAAAALPARMLQARPGEAIADLCAAPGGKTAALVAAGASVVAVDRSAERMQRLKSNLDRLGYTAATFVGDVESYDGGPFDAVLLDAPCSATGTIRRHPDVAWAKRASDIPALAAVQTRLLDKAVSLLRPNGRLVYCTCSLEPEEGEGQIEGLLARHPMLRRDPVTAAELGGLDACVTKEGDLRTLPCHLPASDPRLAGLDGFFAARLVRHG
ncbi:MAG: methyltransferase domain-containing protein [Methylobacteriaceae bacterium]|nr:methyltransferase domain-containing protein [Methylobacteriaceae bacterium]MBV9243993.1 methyltransferase domain-containing protein [Methylobacteriaceae bacterium]